MQTWKLSLNCFRKNLRDRCTSERAARRSVRLERDLDPGSLIFPLMVLIGARVISSTFATFSATAAALAIPAALKPPFFFPHRSLFSVTALSSQAPTKQLPRFTRQTFRSLRLLTVPELVTRALGLHVLVDAAATPSTSILLQKTHTIGIQITVSATESTTKNNVETRTDTHKN